MIKYLNLEKNEFLSKNVVAGISNKKYINFNYKKVEYSNKNTNIQLTYNIKSSIELV